MRRSTLSTHSTCYMMSNCGGDSKTHFGTGSVRSPSDGLSRASWCVSTFFFLLTVGVVADACVRFLFLLSDFCV